MPEALTLTLVSQQLTNLMPQATANTWLGKVRAIAPMQHLPPLQVDVDCQRLV